MANDEDAAVKQVADKMTQARKIAYEVFGGSMTTDAVHDVFDWLEVAPSADELTADLKRVYAHAARVHEVTLPTPEQVFGIFDRVYGDPE